MEASVKLLLLLTATIAYCESAESTAAPPPFVRCPFNETWMIGEWKLGNENMHPTSAEITIPDTEGNLTVYKSKDAPQPFLACWLSAMNQTDCCYNPAFICGFDKHEFLTASYRPSDSGCKGNTTCPDGYDCTNDICCPSTAIREKVENEQCPKGSHLSVKLKNSIYCKKTCQEANQFCFNIFDEKMEFAKYFMLGDAGEEEHKFHCCEHDKDVTHCPLGTFPALLKNLKFTVDTEKELECPDHYYKAKSLTGNGYACCPTIIGHYKESLTMTLDTINQDVSKIKECKDESSCGEKEVCLESHLQYAAASVVYGKKHCYPFPKCGEDEAELEPMSFKLLACDSSETCPGEKPLFCHNKAICCPLKCPYYEKKLQNEPEVIPDDKGVCGKGLMLHDHPILNKICCPVDEDKMCPDGQVPALLDPTKECPKDAKKSTNGICCYEFHSKDLVGIDTEGSKSCTSHSECNVEKEFCGESQFAKGVEQHLIDTPSHCYPRPSFKNADPQLGPKTGLQSCIEDKDCGGQNPAVCAELNVGKNSGSGKVCFHKECPFEAAIKDRTKTCKTMSDCGGVDGCFNLIGSEKHCCPYDNKFMCPGEVFPVPAKDGTPFGECKHTATKLKIAVQEFCCPKLQYTIPKLTKYENDTKFVQKSIPLEDKPKSCIVRNDCAKDEFCANSEGTDIVSRSPKKHCYKIPRCQGDYPAHLYLIVDLTPLMCKEDSDCTKSGTEPKYCGEEGVCCSITTEMCPYYTKQGRNISLHSCEKDDCVHIKHEDKEVSGLHCVEIPKIGKKCCDIDNDKLCPHKQAIGLQDFKKVSDGTCESVGMYKYGDATEYCCRHFQYAEIDQYLPPISSDEAKSGEGGKEKTCSSHDSCGEGHFCGIGGFSKKQSGFIPTPNPKVSLCFPTPTLENSEVMKATPIGLQFCKTNTECKGADDVVVCEQAKIASGEVTTAKMCFQKKCPFGLKSLTPTGTCSSHSDCSNSVCTPIGSTKHCCLVDQAHMCYQKQFPIVKGETEECPEGTIKHPNSAFTTLCCPKFVSTDFGEENTVFADEKECSMNKDCNDKFCSNSKFAYDSGLPINPVKHCYSKPVFEGVPASLNVDTNGIQNCSKAEDCIATNPVVCSEATIDGKAVVGLKFCFEKACSFGEKPTNPALTCKGKGDCVNKEFCVKTFSSTSHCCRNDNNNILCATGEPPVMGENNDPQGKCDANISVQHTIEKKKYCCPLMVHHSAKESFTTDSSKPCSGSSECKTDEFCGESERIDQQPMLKSAKHCYKTPICLKNTDEAKYALLRNDALVSCADSINCNGLREDKPHYCKEGICCELECPYWSKVMAPHGVSDCNDTSTCPDNSQCTFLDQFKAKKCCHVDEEKMCPGDQLPVLEDDGVPSKCPDGSTKHPSAKGVCCASFQSLDVNDNKKPAVPDQGEKFCKTHKECSADEFCGYSEFTENTTPMRGKLAHCYKVPFLPHKRKTRLRPTFLRTIGLFSCKADADCTEATGPVLCKTENGLGGNGFCYESPCPFDLQATNTTATCSDHKDCHDEDSMCTSVHDSTKHCCPVGGNFLCPLFQLPYMQTLDGGCKDGSVVHEKKSEVCCQHFIYNDLAPGFELKVTKTTTEDKECSSHTDCKPNEFCGDSTLSKMADRLQGARRHCYPRLQDAKGTPSSANIEVNLLKCETAKDCKTTNPAVCADAFLDTKPIPGVKMCFEKKCPFGASPVNSQQTCETHENCDRGSMSMCTNVTESDTKHCCPVTDDFKCHSNQMPYVHVKDGKCPDGSLKHTKDGNLCCQRFILKAFGDDTPLYPESTKTECGAHMDCKPDEFCGESTLFKMNDRTFSLPKHCYKRPTVEGALAMVRRDVGLANCTDSSDCEPATHPVVCEDVTDKIKLCFQKECPLKGTTTKASGICSSHSECIGDGALCLKVFGDKQPKSCCKPDNKHRCHWTQLPYVVDGADITPCQDGAELMNNEYCCQPFISKTLKEEVKARDNNQECKSHKQCRESEFCGNSTLAKMDSLVLEEPQHCFKIPKLDGKKSESAMLAPNVGILTCNTAEDCAKDAAAIHPVICKEALGTNLCFQKQCPFGANPANPAQTCTNDGDCKNALCTNVIGKENHCCPVESSLKCFNTQLPYQKGKSECKDDDGENHPTRPELCCRKFINRLLGDDNAVFAENMDKECGSSADCKDSEFCGESTVYKMDSLRIGNPKHCYPKPDFDESSPILVESGLVKCETENDCKTPNPTVCASGTIGGNDIKGLKICYEKPCSLGELSKASTSCTDHSVCGDAVCYNVFSSSKHCCPVGADYTCHSATFPQYPYIKDGTKKCEDGSELHPQHSDLCCQQFTYKTFGESAIFDPVGQEKSCERNEDCQKGEFCGESMLLKMDTRGAPKHCYTRPVLDGNAATLSSGELVVCKDASTCDTDDKVSTCHEPIVPSKSLSGVSICYEADCPLWPVKESIDKKISVICTDQKGCGDFDKTHCVHLYKKEKHCCPVAKTNLCPGGVLPLLDKEDKVLKTCDSKIHYEYEKNKFCCDIPISLKYNEAGVIQESKDRTKTCTKNKDCEPGFFCGLSVTKSGKTLFENKMMHCYEEPKGEGGILKEDDGADITPCDSHDDCQKAKGEYCNNDLGSEYKKGICHLAKCPLAKALTKNTYVTCTSKANCGSEHCHPISGKESGCCTIDDGNFCPSGLIPPTVKQTPCVDAHFQFKANGIDVCCRKIISSTLKKAETDWPLLKTEDLKKIIKAMDDQCSEKKTCNDGFYCDASAALDGSEVENNAKHCYPVPATHGASVVGPPAEIKTCTNSKDCDGANGEICDMLLHDFDSSISAKTGVCSKFFCPLSPSNPISRPPSFKEGTSVCNKLDECSSDNKECHLVGTKETVKGCCGVDKEFLCPGGLFPRKFYKKMNSSDPFGCERHTFKYKWTNEGTPGPDARCCPAVASMDVRQGAFSGEVKEFEAFSPVSQEKTCTKHGDCGGDEFCGESMLEEHYESGRELRVNGKKVHHCYTRPKCSGTTILPEGTGLKICTQETNKCGDNEVCEIGKVITEEGNNKFGETGVCCHYNCKGGFPEVKASVPGISKSICASCDTNKEEYAFCDGDSGGDEHEIRVCEKTEALGGYRLCIYERDPASCPSGLIGTMRNKGTYELIGCNHEVDCRSKRGIAIGEYTNRPRCVAPTKPLEHFSFTKICCQADLCSDMYTDRLNEPVCNAPGDCPVILLKGGKKADVSCEADALGKDSIQHCCPKNENPADVNYADVVNPYRSNKKCTKLADCVGEKRFCDPVTEQCMYHYRGVDDFALNKDCSFEDKDCGDRRIVCLTGETGNKEKAPMCHRHPLHQCITNEDCTAQEEYCAPEIGTNETEYDMEFRSCHTAPKSAKIVAEETGLMHCKSHEDCKDPDLTCDSSQASVALKPGYGFCKSRVEIKCRGNPSIKDVNGKIEPCTTNADCGKEGTHFCDLNSDKLSKWSANEGVCCSKPKDCAGEASPIEVGLKICTDDTFCDTKEGEICDKDIEKPDGSKWKKDEGVCCKMNCPKFDNPEAIESDVVPSGAICEKDNCQSDVESFKSCVSPPTNTTKQRCCSYKRNTSLCPADTLGPVREGLDAKKCTTNEDCATKGAACMGGWCCEQSFCADGFTLKMKQATCSEHSVDADCSQPQGASATCEDGHCCPTMYGGMIQKPFVTDHVCDEASDCPRPLMYCNDQFAKCAHFGSRMDLKTDKPCESDNLTCPEHEGLPGVCVLTDANEGKLVCFSDPLAQRVSKPEALKGEASDEEYAKSKAGLIIGIVAVIIGVLTLIALALFIYFKFTQRRTKIRKEEAARKALEDKSRSEKLAAEQQANEVSAKEPSEAEPKFADVKVDPNCAPLAPQFIAL